MTERLSYLSNITAHSLNKNQQSCTRIKKEKQKRKCTLAQTLSVIFSTHFLRIPWQLHKKYDLLMKYCLPDSHEEINWGFDLDLGQCIIVWRSFLFSKTLVYKQTHVSLFCEHTGYKHLLKGKEFWLMFIQLKQGLYTLHPRSGKESVCKKRQMLMILPFSWRNSNYE